MQILSFAAYGGGLGVWSVWGAVAAAPIHSTPERMDLLSLARDLWTNRKKLRVCGAQGVILQWCKKNVRARLRPPENEMLPIAMMDKTHYEICEKERKKNVVHGVN
ncbi:hypothetical protein KDK_44070 [Dictyobacter kobayashii]|uniref:Uncharacterized protein n=1 Tax=Dictyobacter kobayashii TaxID=2014872 RepID=A0A402AN82_9CHLR|nr:hypothetical protein KDK_44070 [Dictyobacter kobayashii]